MSLMSRRSTYDRRKRKGEDELKSERRSVLPIALLLKQPVHLRKAKLVHVKRLKEIYLYDSISISNVLYQKPIILPKYCNSHSIIEQLVIALYSLPIKHFIA